MISLVPLAICVASLTSCGERGPEPFSAAAQRGRVVFLETSSPHCGFCHRLGDANVTGALGPDLDVLRAPRERIIQSVTHGIQLMPPQKSVLTPGQIQDVAAYVHEAAGRTPADSRQANSGRGAAK